MIQGKKVPCTHFSSSRLPTPNMEAMKTTASSSPVRNEVQ